MRNFISILKAMKILQRKLFIHVIIKFKCLPIVKLPKQNLKTRKYTFFPINTYTSINIFSINISLKISIEGVEQNGSLVLLSKVFAYMSKTNLKLSIKDVGRENESYSD